MAALKRVVLTKAAEPQTTLGVQGGVSSKIGYHASSNTKTTQKLNALYKEFDAITFGTNGEVATSYMPAVKTAEHMTFKVKLYLTSAILVLLLLSFLAVYNAFLIRNISGGISTMQDQVVVAEEDYKAVYDYYNQLRNSTNISDRVVADGFEALADESVMDLSLVQLQEITEIETTSNWFNEFCNFLQTTFGG